MTGGEWRMTATFDATAEKLLQTAGVTTSINVRDTQTQTLSYGTGSGTCSIIALVGQGLPPSGTTTIDLYDGSLLDIYDDPAPFRLVRSWMFFVDSGGDSGGVKLTGGDSNPHGLDWVGTPGTSLGQVVYPEGPAAGGGKPGGTAVTSAARTLKVTNLSAVDVAFKLLLVGTPAVTGVAMGVLGLTYP